MTNLHSCKFWAMTNCKFGGVSWSNIALICDQICNENISLEKNHPLQWQSFFFKSVLVGGAYPNDHWSNWSSSSPKAQCRTILGKSWPTIGLELGRRRGGGGVEWSTMHWLVAGKALYTNTKSGFKYTYTPWHGSSTYSGVKCTE